MWEIGILIGNYFFHQWAIFRILYMISFNSDILFSYDVALFILFDIAHFLRLTEPPRPIFDAETS